LLGGVTFFSSDVKGGCGLDSNFEVCRFQGFEFFVDKNSLHVIMDLNISEVLMQQSSFDGSVVPLASGCVCAVVDALKSPAGFDHPFGNVVFDASQDLAFLNEIADHYFDSKAGSFSEFEELSLEDQNVLLDTVWG